MHTMTCNTLLRNTVSTTISTKRDPYQSIAPLRYTYYNHVAKLLTFDYFPKTLCLFFEISRYFEPNEYAIYIPIVTAL